MVLFVYLGLFTWNIRTGYVDNLASHTGLELTRWVLTPGRWAWSRLSEFWERYVYFVGIRQENETLRAELARAQDELVRTREQASLAERLTSLLLIQPPPEWNREAARVIAHRLGPNAALETFVIDKGSRGGVDVNTPVVTPEGLVGRVLRNSLSASTVIMVTDPNSKIPVVSQKSRTQGILAGRGPGQGMILQYVSLSAPIEDGETLVTTGLEGIFPQGLPVARVSLVSREGASLFLNVQAQPLFDASRLEEVALLRKAPPPKPEEPEDGLPDTSTKRPKGAAERKGEVKKRGRNEPPEARQPEAPKKKRGDGQ
ncbi:Cell shape-determining protein MreC [Fundidesulfovibrio magnetotacticus]|uniref:Cell shape-determining protein MreC n=1 Tax=Fundidesulfovibrio magnetotacticus TaxID=2730080 RepID=A0A6V8LWG4_9BACT|nr:rod shape-determining protein MreC [Fundidesulfovibrio magnetotacticus]GFK95230.1 Cell shape-determining protein MreC [Fundidesulfovibrio magnetotacticus]